MTRNHIIAAPLLALALVAAALGQEPAQRDQPPVVATKSYFVQQNAGEAIVVRVAAFEAEFVARLSTAEGEALAESGLPDARMLPLFQYLSEPRRPRQIDIDIDATQVTNRTDFELELIRLNIRDDRSAGLANAYSLLSAGLETIEGGTVPTWTVKIQTVLQAGSLFSDIGMEEMRLWCRTYAAHLVLHQLRDAQTALDLASEVLRVPQIDRYPEIAFAASKVRSSALAGQRSGDPATSPLQQALDDTLRLARSRGYRYEEAAALQASAVDLREQGLPALALERLNQALDIAVAIGSPDLAAAIREHIVGIHEEFGDAEASGHVLQDIESHLVETGESEQLATNLLRQGELLISGYRYAEAIEALSRGVELEQSALSRIEIELALANALDAAGRDDEALVHFYRAVIEPESGDFRRPSRVLDLASALDAMAAIHGHQGEWERMAEIRRVEEQYVSTGEERARWAFGRAVDDLLQRGVGAQATRARFDEAYRIGRAASSPWGDLSLLRLCALPGADDARCQASALGASFENLRQHGSPRQAAEAAMVRSGALGLRGEAGGGFDVADAQIDALLRSGREPLGAWYWQWRGALFDNYLGLAARTEGADARRSLLALARARLADRGAGPAAPDISAGALRGFLQDLPRDSAVLSYHIGGDAAWAWIGSGSGVRRIALDRPDAIRALCFELRSVIQGESWDAFAGLARDLGRELLAPLSGMLPRTVFLVAHGPLLGIPVDALSLDGSPLAATRRVIYLDRFPATPNPAGRLRMPAPGSVFLAADPRDWSADYPTRLEPSAEVLAVTERFFGPGLHAVEGVALLLDEFDDSRYGAADLVHLALPGSVDLSPQRGSHLVLSEAARGEGRQRLDGAAIRAMPLEASLVFLSRTEFNGRGEALDSLVDPASAMFDAGAGAVLGSFWEAGPESRAAFIRDFYGHLADTANLAEALNLTRRSRLAAGRDADWAGYFLMIR